VRPNLAFVGLCFGIALWLLGLLCAGAGHGTYLPLSLSGAPLSLLPGLWFVAPLLLWTIAGMALRTHRNGPRVVVLVVHLAGIATVLLIGTPFERPTEQWNYFTNAHRQIGVFVDAALLVHVAAVTVLTYITVRDSHLASHLTQRIS